MNPDYPSFRGDFVEELDILGINYFGYQSSLVDSSFEEITPETLIIKKDQNYEITDNAIHKQFILPKYIRCYNINTNLNNLRQRTCAIATKIVLNGTESTCTGTGFLLWPFQKDTTNYIITCAHCVISHTNSKGQHVEVDSVAMSFTHCRDLFDRNDHSICKVVKHGKYIANEFSEDWAILSFDSSNCRFEQYLLTDNIIPSPSIELANLPKKEEFYNIFLVGLCSPSSELLVKKAKEIDIDPMVLGQMIPKEDHEFSLGWIQEVKGNNIYQEATTTQSCSGSAMFFDNIEVANFMSLYRTSDILQQKKTPFKDYIQSHNFSNRMVGIHCGHCVESSRNVGCSVASWFEAFYEIFLELKDLYSKEEQQMIEEERIHMEQLKSKEVK